MQRFHPVRETTWCKVAANIALMSTFLKSKISRKKKKKKPMKKDLM